MKNAKANLKKIEKTLEKEKEKVHAFGASMSLFLLYTSCSILQLKGLEEAPDKCQKDIEEATDQIEVLEVFDMVCTMPCICHQHNTLSTVT